MSQYIRNLMRYKPLLSQLVIRDIKVRYRKSILGVFWTLLNPLLMMIVLSVVFSNIFKFDVANYPVYILSGQVIFNFFSESTSSAMTSVVDNATLLKKIYVPKYCFTISSFLSSIINILASFAALIVVMLFMRMDLHWTILLCWLPVILLVIFSMGVGFILAAYVVKFRDIFHFYSVFLTALMYLMPVIYPLSIIENVPIVREIVNYNPLTIILNMFRDLVMNGVVPSWEPFLIVGLIAIAVLALGLWVFYRRQDTFILDL